MKTYKYEIQDTKEKDSLYIGALVISTVVQKTGEPIYASLDIIMLSKGGCKGLRTFQDIILKEIE